MFHLHYDTRLDALADTLAALLARPDPAHLLQPQTVLVPQPGLQRWLVQCLAERHGIAANLEFIAPAQLVWRVLRAQHAELPPTSAFDRDVLRWRLFDLLQDEDLPPVLRDLVDGEPRELRRFELSTHLAQLFERYQGYRRDMLDDWRNGADRGEPQAELWRRLAAINEPSRARLLGEFLQRHSPADAPPPAGLPPRLFAFGIINVSPDVLRVLGVIGRHCELHFFMPTPCREYWGDVPARHDLKARLAETGGGAFDEPPNPLLMSLGGVGRDFVAQLFSYEQVQPDFESVPDETELAHASLLQRVQADVITLSAPDPAAHRDMPDPDDHSLHVHVCHSPLREVQILHDQLLDLLQRDPELQPRDIAVMVPDLARYAPCVEAVFGALAWDDPRRIPWTVADRPAAETHALVAMFMRLLDLPTSRLTRADVLAVLAVPAVSRRFGVDAQMLEQLGAWVRDAGICWGEDAADRSAQGVPAFEEFSWRFGRQRLLLGYMSGDAADGQLLEHVAPLTDIEGAEAAVLGAAFGVQRLLLGLRTQLRGEHSAANWLSLFNDVLEKLLAPPEGRDEERAMEAIRAALEGLVEQVTVAGYAGALDWTVLRGFVREQLRDSAPQQRFLSGGVSVCGLVPLRNVPFKVICVLGMDADSFPRRDPADALNHIHAERLDGKRKPGDRSVRDDDRYLFLQTLMAARDTLYLSYTGVDLRDGKAREPSVVLSELLDAVCTGYFSKPEAARGKLVTLHPMQPFSRRLFVADTDQPQVFTYRSEWQAAAQPKIVGALPPFVDAPWPVEEVPHVVELDELRRFLRNPAAAFLQKQVGLSLAEDAAAADVREPMTLDSLQQHQLDSALVEFSRHSDAKLATALPQMRAQALLPPLYLGRIDFDEALHDIGPALQRWRAWCETHQPVSARRFQLDLGEGRILNGMLDDLYEDGYAGWVGKATSAGRLLSWWIGALVITALDGPIACVAWGRNKKGAPWRLPRCARMPEPERARELLREMLDLFAQGQCTPLPLPARTGFAYAATAVEGKPGKVLPAARLAWNGGYHAYAEKTDRWFALAFRGRELFDGAAVQAQFEDLVGCVYVPLCMALDSGSAA